MATQADKERLLRMHEAERVAEEERLAKLSRFAPTREVKKEDIAAAKGRRLKARTGGVSAWVPTVSPKLVFACYAACVLPLVLQAPAPLLPRERRVNAAHRGVTLLRGAVSAGLDDPAEIDSGHISEAR